MNDYRILVVDDEEDLCEIRGSFETGPDPI